MNPSLYAQLDAWVNQHFDEEVQFLQALVRVPTDTPPGNNAPHAERTAELLQAMGLEAEKYPVSPEMVHAAGLQSVTNLLVRRRFGPGRTVLLNAHGGNTEAIGVAVAEIGNEHPSCKVAGGTYWLVAPEVFAGILEDQPGVMHACEAETAMMMHVTQGTVRMERLAEAVGPHANRPAAQPRTLYFRRSFFDMTPTGVVGDARRASPEKGAALVEALGVRLAEILGEPALWVTSEGDVITPS